MSLLNTKPRWAPTAIATDRGWCNPNTGEVLVAIGNLKFKIEQEEIKAASVVEVVIEPPQEVTQVPETVIETLEIVIEPQPEEIVMKEEVIVEEPKQKRAYNKKPKVVQEVVEPQKVQQIIGEVVEYDLDKPVIGE